jgi:hypothetical protein
MRPLFRRLQHWIPRTVTPLANLWPPFEIFVRTRRANRQGKLPYPLSMSIRTAQMAVRSTTGVRRLVRRSASANASDREWRESLGNWHDAVAGGRTDQPRDFRPLNGTSLKDPTTSSEAYFRAAVAVMATQPSEVAQDLPARLLARHYGLNGSINVLSSEIERTTEVSLLDGSRLILKTSARPEAIDSFRFQSEAIAALEGASGFVTPRVVRTGGGTLMFREDGVSGYLQTRLLGSTLQEAPRTSELL